MYQVTYGLSRALIIGINRYSHASPLGYAVNDATALADLLKRELGFGETNVHLLTDDAATRQAILQNFLSLSEGGTEPDDRLLVFFAGHGHTVSSIRGEVGFLVPADGDPHDLSTLIRWDELTRDADLIRAKHILFIMDACYGGLAVTRSFSPGAMRFLRDMMQRISRQVLTAGKADETVADLGGPLPHHSVFTGHLLEALGGKAKDNYGNLTANGVTAYVYQAVSADGSARQTPHYGYLHGDGDFIFYPLTQNDDMEATKLINERLVSVPAILGGSEEMRTTASERLKELLSDQKHRIQLHDFMAQRTREVLSRTGQDFFATQGAVDQDAFVERLHAYEESVKDLIPQEMLLCRWGGQEHVGSFRMPLKRLAERLSTMSGSTLLIDSRWYPIFLLMYAGGIGSIVDGNYDNLFYLLHTPVSLPFVENGDGALINAITKPMATIHDCFKWFPEYNRRYTPRSDYIYKLLQPPADDTLFVGEDYDVIFDRFELLLFMQHAHLQSSNPLVAPKRARWGGVGRFGWKDRDYPHSPLKKLVGEAMKDGDQWRPLTAGFFGGSPARFKELASDLQAVIDSLSWY